MEDLKEIAEIGSEGGSVVLYQIKNEFFFKTEEFLFVDEFDLKDLTSKSEMYSTIEDAILALVTRYSIFNLYPMSVDNEYKKLFKVYFDNFILYKGKEDCSSLEEWERILIVE